MSEIFEGIIVPGLSNSLWLDGASAAQGLELETQVLEGGLSVAYRSDPRTGAGFTSRMEQLASEASKNGKRVLLVRFDSRTSHRSAVLFENGQLERSFGEADELYVPLRNTGEPVRDAAPLRCAELDPDEEYETTDNAIQLGLRALGHGNWDELLDVMTAA